MKERPILNVIAIAFVVGFFIIAFQTSAMAVQFETRVSASSDDAEESVAVVPKNWTMC